MARRVLLYSALSLVMLFVALVLGINSRGPLAYADAVPAATKPIPKEESNCVRCHLTAGRELTEAVHTFAHSVHDVSAGVSCHDCHGGNLEDDAKAHMAEFNFIGTKMSAHLAKCQECHQEQYESLSSGPHKWDQQKRLNIKYPLCVDCHGNHDVGNPPAEFSLTLVCSECHRGFQQKDDLLSSLTNAEDQMWAAIIAWKKNHAGSEDRVPPEMNDGLTEIRKAASEIIHKSVKPEPAQLEALVGKMKDFTTQIQAKSTASEESAKNGN